MPSMNRVHKSLILCEPHVCCDDADAYLYPPRKGTDGWVPDIIGSVQYKPIDTWYLDNGCGCDLIPVQYCPFCGIRLEEPVKENK